MTFPINTVRVGLEGRGYDVVIGPALIAQAGRYLAPYIPRQRTIVVSDRTVAALHGEALSSALRDAGIKVDTVTVESGEESKSFDTLASVIDQLLSFELDRGDIIIAFGGGVIGDLTGFAAAIYKRGIGFIQIPTTLLAQVDSSVGGKTAIDTPRGKNLVGAFHQPRLVVADLDVLSTLDNRQLRAGFGEILKYGLLGDAAFFSWLEKNGAAVLARDKSALAQAVTRSVQMKADIVSRDEHEAGPRALLNLGHTFAHALEAETGFGEVLLHGEAVALGCALAFRFSAAQGLCQPDHAMRASEAIEAAGLPTRLSDLRSGPFSATRLLAHMAQDKKAEAGGITLILAQGIGRAFCARQVDRIALENFLVAEGASGA